MKLFSIFGLSSKKAGLGKTKVFIGNSVVNNVSYNGCRSVYTHYLLTLSQSFSEQNLLQNQKKMESTLPRNKATLFLS